MILPIAGLLLLLGYSFIRQALNAPASQALLHHQVSSSPVEASALPPGARTEQVSAAAAAKPAGDAPSKSAGKHRGDIVLILDDVGFDHQPLAGAMTIDPNLNFAILPNGDRAHESARRLDANGFELLCHLPMEPIDYPHTSPGPNAILTSMSDEEIARVTLANIEAIPHVRGVNNHMGSRATQDRRVMNSVLRALPKDLYFIDSKTTGGSIAGTMAREMSIPTASRQVFLDDIQSEGAIRRQLASLTEASEERGLAVGIGHIYPVTVRVLNEEVPRLRQRGFRFVRASSAVN
jgi:polysaccharide deacetylase 2 family uncharacterized protein YibQ